MLSIKPRRWAEWRREERAVYCVGQVFVVLWSVASYLAITTGKLLPALIAVGLVVTFGPSIFIYSARVAARRRAEAQQAGGEPR